MRNDENCSYVYIYIYIYIIYSFHAVTLKIQIMLFLTALELRTQRFPQKQTTSVYPKIKWWIIIFHSVPILRYIKPI